MRRWLAVAAVLLTAACSTPAAPSYLVLATTTSVGNAGLLDALLPVWQDEALVEVRVSLAGSGRALRMMEEGLADVVISHAPATEAEFLKRHPDWTYKKLMYTEFVLVGPPADPAKVAEAGSIADAMRRLAASTQTFLSRGDDSGTHERERALWSLAGVEPPADRLLVTGAAMATTLRQASQQAAYTLTDLPTFQRLEQNLDLKVLLQGGPELRNPYAVLTTGDNPKARLFAEWLAEKRGRELISQFEIGPQPAYHLWPADAPRSTPGADPF